LPVGSVRSCYNLKTWQEILNRELDGTTVAVTGAGGFIGTNLIRHLNTFYNIKKIVAIDNLFNSSTTNCRTLLSQDNLVMYKEDIEYRSSLEYIFRDNPIDYVFNLATKPLNYSFKNPSNACLTNAVGVLNLLELLRGGMYSSLCHISSSEVYGSSTGSDILTEESKFRPCTPYAAGKAAADHAVQSYVKMFDLDAVVIRPFNNYGPHQNAYGPLAAVIPRTISRIKMGKCPVIQGHGLQSREFVFVLDTVNIICSLFQQLEHGAEVNISSGEQFTILEVINRICTAMDYDHKNIIFRERRIADVDAHRASNALLSQLYSGNFTPFADGLLHTIAWYLDTNA